MCTILILDFSKEQRDLPEDDKQCAIETCRRIVMSFLAKRAEADLPPSLSIR
jgi:hypothetical protein